MNKELSGLLDFTLPVSKKFIADFMDRVEHQRRYDEKVKQAATANLKKAKLTETKSGSKDISKFLVAGRQACYCQCTKHNLVNNCTNCGKIVCEQEGEGPCLFCGAWVDRETMYDVGEDSNEYEVALQHRDRLIEYDVNAAQRLGVLDAQSDWYDLSNNTWLNKEQRKYAKQMQEVEKKRQEDIDSKMNVTIDLAKGTTDLKVDEQDAMFAFGAQNQMVNEYLGKQAQQKKQHGVLQKERTTLYRPFESMDDDDEAVEDKKKPNDPMAQFANLASFSFKAFSTTEEKQLKVK